jgi:transcription elongation GreA/GreB family factor
MKDLISEHGYKKYLEEFNQLVRVEKPHWVKEKEIAAAFGDRSENAEYLSAKEMLRNIDKRLRFFRKNYKLFPSC